MENGGILMVFFGASFLLALWIAGRLATYFSMPRTRTAVKARCAVESRYSEVEAASVTHENGQDGLPEPRAISSRPRVSLEMVAFASPAALTVSPSCSFGTWLTPIRNYQIPIADRLFGRRRSDSASTSEV